MVRGMSRGKDERPPITKSDIRRALRQGHIPFTIDRPRVEELENFVSTPIGSYVEIHGIAINYPERRKLVLRPLLSNPYVEIELLNVGEELGSRLHGETVKIIGKKVGRCSIAVESIRRWALDAPPPPISFEYVKDMVLDGIELGIPEDLAALALVSSPRYEVIGLGGIHVTFIGKGYSYLDKRLRCNTISIPRFWRYGKTTASSYVKGKMRSLASRSKSTYVEYSLNVQLEKNDILPELPVDYPIHVVRASREDVYPDFDVMDYSVYVKALRPSIGESDEVRRKLEDIAIWFEKWVQTLSLPPDVVGRGKLIDLDYLGKPASIIRIAQALARTAWSRDATPFIDRAKQLIAKALESIAEQFSTRPTRVMKLSELEALILKVIERLEASYQRGVPLNAIIEELRVKGVGVRDVVQALDRLRLRGYVYCPIPEHYRVVRI